MKKRRKVPRRQIMGIVGIGTLALIIGQENVDRAMNVDGKNRRTWKERRKDEN